MAAASSGFPSKPAMTARSSRSGRSADAPAAPEARPRRKLHPHFGLQRSIEGRPAVMSVPALIETGKHGHGRYPSSARRHGERTGTAARARDALGGVLYLHPG